MSRIGGRRRRTGDSAAAAPIREECSMKYMLLMNYGEVPGVPPMSEWAPEEVQAHGAAMDAIHRELAERGELVGTAGLAGPDAAKVVTHDGLGAPVVTDGPFP